MAFEVLVEVKPRELVIYVSSDGECPFEKWLNKLKDVQGRAIIRKRLNRVKLGNLGDAKSVGKGIQELRIDVGPGYRVYFGEDKGALVVLLCGGDKSTQERDIKKAQEYWQDYLSQ